MIKLSIRSGTYTKKQLDKKLAIYFDKKLDIDLFLEAIVETGQTVKKGKKYVFPEVTKQTYTTPRYYTLTTYIYGGRERVGIRGGKEWIDARGYPTGMIISRAYINGKWIDIKEKPRLKLVKGRSPETREAWRAEIPADIKNKYNIISTTPIRVRVDKITHRYLTNLQLWGYRYRVMLSYGETKNGANIRNLEIDGRSFINNIKRDISKTIIVDQQRIKKTILGLLSDGDPEYYGLYEETESAGNVGENIEAIPLRTRTTLVPIVELRDLDNKRVILNWNTDGEKTKIPNLSEFNVSSTINQGISRARGQTKLGKRWSNKGGF